MSEWLKRVHAAIRGKGHADNQVGRDLFLRCLGVVYLCAFASLLVQIRGLCGEQGIVPVGEFLEAAREQLPGVAKYHLIPTLCWISSRDGFLLAQCVVGLLFSVLLIAGFVPAVALPVLWVLWLSLTVACGVFLGFQWENLLLETGLLAIFYAPAGLWLKRLREPSMVIRWLLRWLVFRLMFLSGVVKLLSGDPAWRNFTALFYHYETQPLPTPIGWYAYQLSSNVHVLETGMMYLIELVVPFLIFVGPRCRLTAAIAFTSLQLGIALTGNYAYFNLLTIVLCIPLVDDRFLFRVVPMRWRGRGVSPETPVIAPSLARPVLKTVHQVLIGTFAVVVGIVSTIEILRTFGFRNFPAPVLVMLRAMEPFRSINSYGLFAVMTKSRPEIIVEGSNDAQTWSAYEFRFKPGDPKRRPMFVAPHQPRLDWQMWFAALSNYQENPWFVRFCVRILEGKREVLVLLRSNPFPEKPPAFLRAVVYNYEFTSPKKRSETGEWWKREYVAIYFGPISLKKAGAAVSQKQP